MALSCHRRGFCPSCHGRFAADRAAHLVDRVLPRVPLRQWVLSLPPPFRFLTAYDTSLCSAVLGWLRSTAKRELGPRSVQDAHPGAVTAIQRCGSALNLNLHYHTLAVDGVFVVDQDTALLRFVALPGPSDADVSSIGWESCLRIDEPGLAAQAVIACQPRPA